MRITESSKKYYKHEFLDLTLEYFYRFVLPPPFNILSQALMIVRDYRINPFGNISHLPDYFLFLFLFLLLFLFSVCVL